MLRKSVLPVFLVFSLATFACGLAGTATPTELPTIPPVTPTETPQTPTASPSPFPTFTSTPVPAATDTAIPIDTAVPFPTSTSAPAPTTTPSSYIDDRSTPSQVIVSLYNAINRREYLRAYSYWNDPATSLGDFDAYANGYQDTASVSLVFGQITGEPGMSQVYYTVPVLLKTTAGNGTHTNYAACYVVHEVTPEVISEPPTIPMEIYNGQAKLSDLNASDATALSTACDGFPQGSSPVPVESSPLNIDASNFLDNRSGPIETVSSFLNSLNLKQYVRAYSYFQNPTTFPGSYDPFAAGYANTAVITVTFGTVLSEGAAGSLYYKVPLALHATTTANVSQLFVGCYTLRLAQPTVQGTPPYQPMGIVSGKFNQVANGTNVNGLLPTACN